MGGNLIGEQTQKGGQLYSCLLLRVNKATIPIPCVQLNPNSSSVNCGKLTMFITGIPRVNLGDDSPRAIDTRSTRFVLTRVCHVLVTCSCGVVPKSFRDLDALRVVYRFVACTDLSFPI